MKLYIKQKAFSFREQFHVYDQNGSEVYYIESEGITFTKKFHVYNNLDEVAFIHQKAWSLLPKFFININGMDIASVTKEFSWFRPKYTIGQLGWFIEGNMNAHEYEIVSGDHLIATIHKEWFTLGDAYEINITASEDVLYALCIVIVIDAIVAMEQAAAASA